MQYNNTLVPYNQPQPTMSTINIDSYKVEANDSVINGNNNVIFGNNNTVHGNNNKVYGNNNKVVGNDNSIKGEQNAAEGARNEVCSPFGSSQETSSSFKPASPSVPIPALSIPRNTPMNAYPTTVSPRSYQETVSPRYQEAVSPRYQESYPSTSPYSTTPPANFPMSTSPTFGTSPMASYPMPSAYSQAIVPMNMPMHIPAQQVQWAVVSYVNPFATIPVQSGDHNPFESPRHKEKELDLINDGTMVFMIKEWESDYVREFCQLVQMNSGQKVGYHNSCGRTCIVGLGDLEKIRKAIIDLLPQLNLRLKEWSWNSFGNKVCSDRELFEKRLFQEYKKEDVECWRDNSGATKAAA